MLDRSGARMPAHAERDEERAEDEADDAAPVGRRHHEQRDPDPHEHEGEDDHRAAVRLHATPVAVTMTRHGAFLST